MMMVLSRQRSESLQTALKPLAASAKPAAPKSAPNGIDRAQPMRGLVWAVCLSSILYVALGIVLWLTL